MCCNDLGVLTKPLYPVPTDKQTSEDEERIMDVVPFFVSHTQTSMTEQPIERAFNYIAELPQPAAVRRVPLGNQRDNPPSTQRFSDLVLRVVGSIGQDEDRALASSTVWLLDGRHGVHQRDGHLRIVYVRGGVLNGQGYSGRVRDQVTFRPVFPAIRGIRAGLDPPKSARVEQLSITAADHSILPALPNSSRSRRQILPHTPATCQSRNRRQQVIPHPQPISCGNSSHWVPVRSTNRMPVSAARSGTRGRPPWGLGGSGGKSGLIRSHSSSVSSGLAIIVFSITHTKHPRERIGQTTARSVGFVRVL